MIFKNTEIIEFCNGNPSNKLIIYEESKFAKIECLNLGLELAKRVNMLKSFKNIKILLLEYLEELINKNIKSNSQIGNYICLKNFGLLLEKESGVDLVGIFNKYSRSCCLIIEWPGEIEQNKIYFLSKNKGIEFNLSEISHLIL